MAKGSGYDGSSRRFHWSVTWVSWIASFVQRAFLARIGPFGVCEQIAAEAKVDDCLPPSLEQPNDLLAAGKEDCSTIFLCVGGMNLQVEFCASAVSLPRGIARFLQIAALYKFGAQEQKLS